MLIDSEQHIIDPTNPTIAEATTALWAAIFARKSGLQFILNFMAENKGVF